MYLEARPSFLYDGRLLSLQCPDVVVTCYTTGCDAVNQSEIRSQVKRDYPLNLSILLRGGKEHNYDALSNGE